MSIAPTQTTPLYDLIRSAQDLTDRQISNLVESLSTAPTATADAWAALRAAVAAEGIGDMLTTARAEAWDPAMDSFDARVYNVVEDAYCALAFRELIGSYRFTAAHYDALTAAWRILVGPIHLEDADLRTAAAPAETNRPAEVSGVIAALANLTPEDELLIRKARTTMGLNTGPHPRVNAVRALDHAGRSADRHWDALRLIAARPTLVLGQGLFEARLAVTGYAARDLITVTDFDALAAPWRLVTTGTLAEVAA